jgi:PAS domain S-box-containing protein
MEALQSPAKIIKDSKKNLIFDLHPEATLIIDSNGIITDCNKAFLDFHRCKSKNCVLNRSMLDFIAKNDQLKTMNILNSGCKITNVEVDFLVEDGCEIPAEISVNFIKDSLGKISDAILSIRDASQRKRTFETLKRDQQMFNTLMESMPDAIYFKDLNSRFIRINRPKAIRLGLKDPEEAVGKTDFDFYDENFAREAYEDEQKIMKTGEALVGKVEEVRSKDGITHWVSATKIPIKDDDGKIIGLVGISRDITDLKLMERELEHANIELKRRIEELRRVQEELKRSNKELENYTYAVSHDLKAPLRAIRSFVSFLLEDYSEKLDEEGLEYLKRIDAAATRMNEFIEDLLLLSRVGRKFMEIEKVDLNNLLEEIIQDFKPMIDRKNAKVIVNRLPVLHIQRVWIKQLFMNLVDNGLKFNRSEDPTVEVSCEEKTDEYLFKVSDNGIGIREEHLNKLFNLFERLHSNEEYEGTGAGLAICKKIVENWGGKIWVESIFGKGSTFFFTIPKKYGMR